MMKAKIEQILPFLTLCKKKKKEKTFKSELRKALRAEILDNYENADGNMAEVEEEPFLLLGFGINSYFHIKSWLMSFFMVLTIFSLPALIYFSMGDSSNGLADETFYFFKQFSLGNLAGADVVCKSKVLRAGKLAIDCPAGTIIDYDNVQYGVMSEGLSASNYCLESRIWEREKPELDVRSKCSNWLNKTYV